MNIQSAPPRVVSESEWLAARQEHLRHERELTHQRDKILEERRKLPWLKITKNYLFDSLGGRQTLAELFAGRNQLIVYHFMFGPGWEEGCRSCSFLMDHIDGTLPHLNARDTTFVAVSRASLPEIEAFRKRMGWKFKWVSSYGSDFNPDFHVSFTKEDMEAGRVNYNYQNFPPGLMPVEELPGVSVYALNDAGEVFHTYSTYARGCEPLLGTYQWLDLTAKGRNEAGLAHLMAWVRHHDAYDRDYKVDPKETYQPPQGSLFRPCGGNGKTR